MLLSIEPSPITPWHMNIFPGFVGKTADPYVLDVLADPEYPGFWVPSMYGLTDFHFNIKVVGMEDEEDAWTVVSLKYKSNDLPIETLSTQVDNDNVTLQGLTGSFPGEFFSFKMNDDSVKNLNPSNPGTDWKTITKWSPPPRPWTILGKHTIEVEYEAMLGGINKVDIEVNQYIHWNWDPSLNHLQRLVSQGEY
jgi:hypothetical protein